MKMKLNYNPSPHPWLQQVASLILIACWMPLNVQAWTTKSSIASSRLVAATNSLVMLHDASEGEQASDQKFQSRMEMVRSLQMSYYKTNDFQRSSLDASTESIHNLPLWRMGLAELPGRSNLLNVHEPVHTNMFQSILSQPKPWYFGHLYLPDGNCGALALQKRQNPNDGSVRRENESFKLKTWKDNNLEETEGDAVLGTLMSIADYRRMEDGRLFLLVEALERFAISSVQQELPYSIADVQLLPDTEEVDPDDWVADCTEGGIHGARSLAIAESFQHYHLYEYYQTLRLPISSKSNLQTSDIGGSMLALMVPLVPLSKTVDLAKLKETLLSLEADGRETRRDQQNDTEGDNEANNDVVADGLPCLEQLLLKRGILKEYHHPDETVNDLSSKDLEYRIWIEINNFLKSTKAPVSPVLLGLMPPEVK